MRLKIIKIFNELAFAIFMFMVPLISWWLDYSVDKEMGLLLGYIMGWQFMKFKNITTEYLKEQNEKNKKISLVERMELISNDFKNGVPYAV